MNRRADYKNNSRDRYKFEDIPRASKRNRKKLPEKKSEKDLEKRFGLRASAERHIETHLIEKLPGLSEVSGFLLVCISLIVLLIIGLVLQIRDLTPYHTQTQASQGGIYVEGLVGRATNFNPIYATTEADKTVSRLVFANLYNHRQQAGEFALAQSVESDQKARQYKVTLKKNLQWHDGQPLTIDDVIFTIQTILNPEAQSPLRTNWEGVHLDKIDERTIIFTLEAGFSPFVNHLALGILPKHLLQEEDIKQLRDAAFNYQPIGSGPFIFERLVTIPGEIDSQEIKVELRANPKWKKIAGTKQPILLHELHLWIVPDKQRLTQLFNSGLLSGAFDLDPDQISLTRDQYQSVDLKTMNAVYLFFKHSSSLVSDLKMRQALTAAIDPAQLLASLDHTPYRIFGPLLPEHDGYSLKSKSLGYNPAHSKQLLQLAGWKQENEQWKRKGQTLTLTLTTQKDTDYEILAKEIKRQLERLDIQVNLDLRSAESIPLEVLQNHSYGDLLIYGLNLGNDSDVYSYWHSSQINTTSTLRLNLSEYRSQEADTALEAGRSRSELELRRQRYADFQTIWMSDLPALALYRLQMRYYTIKGVRGPLKELLLSEQSDRLSGVAHWATIQKRISL